MPVKIHAGTVQAVREDGYYTDVSDTRRALSAIAAEPGGREEAVGPFAVAWPSPHPMRIAGYGPSEDAEAHVEAKAIVKLAIAMRPKSCIR
ncbi:MULTISPECIES: hypothetical protein [Methylobacterium]|uniref:hypothetical protein n=1 Tax=Methylobacterium TaxID=407 RepID=UPI0012E7F06B|nr:MULTISPECIES: hypothetical protein [Methylobacterium]